MFSDGNEALRYILNYATKKREGQMELVTYEAVAKQAGLEQSVGERFVEYMRTRWGNHEKLQCRIGYAGEWALHFKMGTEYRYSDTQGKSLLESMSKEIYHAGLQVQR